MLQPSSPPTLVRIVIILVGADVSEVIGQNNLNAKLLWVTLDCRDVRITIKSLLGTYNLPKKVPSKVLLFETGFSILIVFR